MEISEQNLPLTQLHPFARLRLFHFYDHVSAREHFLCAVSTTLGADGLR